MTEPYALFEEARKQGPNPFRLKPIVSADEVWGDVVTDLPDLNQHVDKKIYQAISEIRQKYSDKIGIAIKGDRGTGKTHVIHRIWKTIEHDGGAVFAYIPPISNPNRIDFHVRFYLTESFDHKDIRGVTQWQRLAIAMLYTLKDTEFEEQYYPYLERCNQPDELRKYILDAYNELLTHIAVTTNDDDDKLASIILCAMKMIPEGGTANVVITEVDSFNTPSHDLHFIVYGYDTLQKKQVKIGVRVCETKTSKTFNAVMKRLLSYETHNINRGCLVRSTSVPKSWKVGQKLRVELERDKGGEVVELKKDEVKPLIAIKTIYDEAAEYGFSNDQVTGFVKELRLAAENPLICEILSAPV